MPTRILVVEDDQDIAQLVARYLEKAGFVPEVVSSGRDALTAIAAQAPGLIVLDLMLPQVDGLEVCRAVRGREATAAIPIIMLTARAADADRIVGLELGADDYLAKPFSPNELVARVRAVLRRAEGAAFPSDVIRVGSDVELDVPRMEARFAGRRVDLTKSEFQIVSAMARQPGRVFTRSQLLDAVRGVAFE